MRESVLLSHSTRIYMRELLNYSLILQGYICFSNQSSLPLQTELCKKDLEFVLKAEADELKDVKKNPTMKLSTVFHSTYAKVKELLESNKPIRDGDFTNVEVRS